MENVAEYDNTALMPLYQLYMQVVAWATFYGLTFPIIFLQSNQREIAQASNLTLVGAILVVLCFLLHTVSAGQVFPEKLSPKWIRRILYGWGFALLGLTAWLVYCTGGVQSSIFVWLFEYALILAVILRPKEKKRAFFKQWRPVLVVTGFDVFVIAILTRVGPHSIELPKTMDKLMPIWGGLSIICTLITSFLVFYVSEKILKIGG